MKKIVCIDLFCGAGGLTHGFVLEGLSVKAGIDFDPACKYAFEANNNARFIEKDVSTVTASELAGLYGKASHRVLAGCAPCQPFSTYSQRYGPNASDEKWGLLGEFGRLVRETEPDVVTMENVPSLVKQKVFADFVTNLKKLNYQVWFDIVNCSEYGVPQTRKRTVLLASKYGEIKLHKPKLHKQKTVRQAIGKLPSLAAGESDKKDALHTASRLSQVNLERIRISRPGGTWRDWPEKLVSACHKAESGRTFPSVYGRMEWEKPAPTMTTQCYGYGNGRFGHPDQDRAISLREAAILQSFPKDYSFVPPDSEIKFREIGRLIGNAVPVELGRAIAKSIKSHFGEVFA
jgi:DNA (cytosine-5)-methyltransferase 1